jgi:hypothetical protein
MVRCVRRDLTPEQHVAAYDQPESAAPEILEGDTLAKPEALDPEDGVEFRVHGALLDSMHGLLGLDAKVG